MSIPSDFALEKRICSDWEGVGNLPDRIRAQELKYMITKSLDALAARREEINQLNVFPVPDGDTGTNMYLTLQAVIAEMERCSNHDDMSALCGAITKGSLMGARGNSGVVLSQILKGVCEVFQKEKVLGVGEFSEALARGSEVAYRAVMRPVEGTILTVIREAADEGRALAKDARSLEEWLKGVIDKSRTTLEFTPELLPVLKEAGVVDAGGMGLVVFLEGLYAALTGEEIESVSVSGGGVPLPHEAGEEEGRYEAQFLLRCKDAKIEEFKERLKNLGSSVLVVGGDKVYRVHIHTDELGRVIEEASSIGRLSEVEITDLKEQIEDVASRKVTGEDGKKVGLVAVAVGDGIKEILKNMGVDVVVNGGQSMNPSTAEMLEAIESLPYEEVMVVPNNKNIIPAAEQTQELTNKKITVIPAKAITEGFSSLIVFDPQESCEVNREKMVKAIAGVRTGAVTIAVRDSHFGLSRIKKGDYIGLFQGKIVAAGKDLGKTTTKLIQKMIDDHSEIITMVIGEEAVKEASEEIIRFIEGTGIDFEVIEGGQPVYHYIIGVE